MPTPSISYVISGIITKSNGLVSPNSVITFTSSGGTDTHTTELDGKYVYDLANLGYTSGETVTYSVVDESKNETYSGTFEVTGDNKDLNIALSLRTTTVPLPSNRATHLYNIGGEIVSEDNPLPVTLINTIDLIDLTNNPDWEQTHDSSGRLIEDKITIKGVTYNRTYTYTGTNFFWSVRSKWQIV